MAWVSHPCHKKRDKDGAPGTLLRTKVEDYSIEAEVHQEADLDRDCLTLLILGRFELVLADGFHCLLVQAHAYRADDADVLRVALGIDNQADEDCAFVFCPA